MPHVLSSQNSIVHQMTFLPHAEYHRASHCQLILHIAESKTLSQSPCTSPKAGNLPAFKGCARGLGRVLTLWRLLHMLRHFDPLFSGLWKICIVLTPIFEQNWGKCHISTPNFCQNLSKCIILTPFWPPYLKPNREFPPPPPRQGDCQWLWKTVKTHINTGHHKCISVSPLFNAGEESPNLYVGISQSPKLEAPLTIPKAIRLRLWSSIADGALKMLWNGQMLCWGTLSQLQSLCHYDGSKCPGAK